MKNKVFAAVLSAICAFGLWIYVITVVSPDYEDSFSGIPVSLQSEAVLADRGLIITSTNTGGVTLRLSGNRSDLAGLHSGNIRIVADVSKIYEPGVHNVTYSVLYPGNIAAGAVSVQTKNPDTVQIVVEQLVTKEIPVVLDDKDTKVPLDYLCDLENAVLSTEKITISGPKSAVDKIAQARIEINLTDKKQTIDQDFSFTLCDRTGNAVENALVTKSAESVNVRIRIVRIKTVPLVFTVIYGSGLKQENVTIHYNLSELQISGSEDLLNALNSLAVEVDISNLLSDQKIKIPILMPEGITNETGITEVEADVKFSGVEVKTFQVANISYNKNTVPADCLVAFVTKSLNVTLRGPESILSNVTAGDIEVVLDLSGVTPDGYQTIPATVQMDAIFENVAAVGTYTVTVNITAA